MTDLNRLWKSDGRTWKQTFEQKNMHHCGLAAIIQYKYQNKKSAFSNQLFKPADNSISRWTNRLKSSSLSSHGLIASALQASYRNHLQTMTQQFFFNALSWCSQRKPTMYVVTIQKKD